jgi:hypothetical protein
MGKLALVFSVIAILLSVADRVVVWITPEQPKRIVAERLVDSAASLMGQGKESSVYVKLHNVFRYGTLLLAFFALAFLGIGFGTGSLGNTSPLDVGCFVVIATMTTFALYFFAVVAAGGYIFYKKNGA